MKRVVCAAIVLSALVFTTAHPGEAAVDIGVSVGDEGLQSFYLAVGDHYRVPQSQIVVITERQIPHYEVPVVLFLAQRAHVAPAAIVDLRLRGMTWTDITLHFGLSPAVYYVPVTHVPGPPYGKAYGYYKKKPRKQWRSIVLDDDDVVNLVNLRFLSNHYHYKPEEVIKLRSKGQDFVVINEEVRRTRAGKVKHEKHPEHGEVKETRQGKGHNEFKETGSHKEVKEHKEKSKSKGKGKKED